MKQQSLGLGQSTKRTRRREFLSEMERVVPWADLVALDAQHLALEGLSADESGLLGAFRELPLDDQAALLHLLGRLANDAKPRQIVRPLTVERQLFLKDAMR